MELPRRLAVALHTLSAAVDLLERATDDAAASEAARLDALLAANKEVGARLDRVAATLRALSDRQDPALPDGMG